MKNLMFVWKKGQTILEYLLILFLLVAVGIAAFNTRSNRPEGPDSRKIAQAQEPDFTRAVESVLMTAEEKPATKQAIRDGIAKLKAAANSQTTTTTTREVEQR